MKRVVVLALTAWSISGCAGQSQPIARSVSTVPVITATAPTPQIVPTIARPSTAAIETTTAVEPTPIVPTAQTIQEYDVPRGSHPHDVAPASDGTVWYTAQAAGELGRLDPESGQIHRIPLGAGSAPHGVIVGPDVPRGSPMAA